MRYVTLLGLAFLLPIFQFGLFANDPEFHCDDSEHVNLDISALIQKVKANTFKDLNKALCFANIAQKKVEEQGMPEKFYRIEQLKGWCFENNNLLDSASTHYTRALEYAIQNKNEKQQLEAYSDLAVIARRLTKYTESKDYRLKALEIANRLEDLSALAVTYHGLGTLYKEIGDYQESAAYFLKAISFNEQSGDLGRMVNTMQFLATTYAEAEHFDIALETIRNASQMALELKDTILMGIVAFDYGKILGMLDQHDAALEQFQSALWFFQDIQHKPLIARTLLYIGDNFAKQEKYGRAFQYFNQCLELEPYISMKGQADLNYKLADLHFQKNELQKAEALFEKSLMIAEKYKLKDFCQKNNHRLYQLYTQKDRPEKALQHLESYTRFKKMLLNEEKAKKIVELQFKYDLAKHEQELQQLQIQQSEMVQRNSIAMFSIILLFLVYAVWSYKKNNSRLKLKNAEIQKKNINLRESNEVLKQFAYVTGHDLKEPLRNIGSFVNLIDRRFGNQMPEQAKEYMEFVINGVKRMDNLLSSLLEYSAISGQKATEHIIISHEILDEVILNMKNTIALKNATIECSANLPNLRMSPLHLTQLFQNLIGNALKFAEADPVVKISGKITENELHFSIRDNGIGIHSDHGNKIFKLFYKPNKGSTANGMGIGLSICKNIVDKYNGRIWFEKNKEKGTIFHFTFPKELAA